MNPHKALVPLVLLAAAGCASAPAPQEQPVVVETEQQPFEVAAYVPPPDEPPPADLPPLPARPPAPPVPSGRPAQVDGGVYRLSIAASRSAADAAQWVRRAESLGYRAVVEDAVVDGITWYRVVLPGFGSKDDVLRALDLARTEFDAPGAWRLPNEK